MSMRGLNVTRTRTTTFKLLRVDCDAHSENNALTFMCETRAHIGLADASSSPEKDA